MWTRKAWEYLYLWRQFRGWAQTKEDLVCLGYGCGNERIPYMLANDPRVARVIVTDEPTGAEQWVGTNQYIGSLGEATSLAHRYCPGNEPKITYAGLDMKTAWEAPAADFVWSASSLEHLGSMDASIDFLVEATLKLNPGGLSAHCTEYNTDGVTTRMSGDSIYFRREDLERLRETCQAARIEVGLFDLTNYHHPYNSYVDQSPYPAHPAHMRLRFDSYVITSIGICLRRMHD